METAVVFGGAGFIGRGICRALAQCGWRVYAADGLMALTTCDEALVRNIPDVNFVKCVTDEQYDVVEGLVSEARIVVDAMGWTRHLEALQDPLWDLRLNVASHLPVLKACIADAAKPRTVIYLASSHQYGKGGAARLAEVVPCSPGDVQGVHKLAAEHHWRVAAGRAAHLSVVSLRFGNTFGPGMPFGVGDVGLIGGFFWAAIKAESVRVFGAGRRRNVIFSDDIAGTVCKLSAKRLPAGFQAFNLAGHDVFINDLAAAVVRIAGSGSVQEEPMPDYLRKIDVGDATLDDSKLQGLLDSVPTTELESALRETYVDLRGRFGFQR